MHSSLSVVEALDASYRQWKVSGFRSRRFSPGLLWQILDRIIEGKETLFNRQEVGQSFEGRPILLVSVGAGNTTVMLWSQMHGDESTATMAIADILNYCRLHGDQEVAKTVLSSLNLVFLPMLNPDGAARFQRRTAQGIDMNRDALAFRTPEARILRKMHEQFQPQFAFNLHDQELSTVGDTRELTAMAVLAPAFDEQNSDNEIRRRAKLAAATLIESLNRLIPGKVARYDDRYEPRAFGDAMQRWGTSTILIESGHIRNDPEKQTIRRLNAVGILSALYAIATGEYVQADLHAYESLPHNTSRAYDVIIRDVRLQHKNGMTTTADLGISYQVDTHTEDPPLLVDIGDLQTFVGLQEVDGSGTPLEFELLTIGKPFFWTRYFPSP